MESVGPASRTLALRAPVLGRVIWLWPYPTRAGHSAAPSPGRPLPLPLHPGNPGPHDDLQNNGRRSRNSKGDNAGTIVLRRLACQRHHRREDGNRRTGFSPASQTVRRSGGLGGERGACPISGLRASGFRSIPLPDQPDKQRRPEFGPQTEDNAA